MKMAEQDVKDLATPKSSIHQISSRSSKPSGLQRQNPVLESSAVNSASPTWWTTQSTRVSPKRCAVQLLSQEGSYSEDLSKEELVIERGNSSNNRDCGTR